MPNYNTQLQSNNTDLQAILNTINELPEAGSGGEQATPEISINSTNGLITATAGTKSSTYQLAFEPAKTVYPTNIDYVAIQGGRYLGGDITVGAVPTQTKTVTPSATTQEVKPSAGYFFSKVTVNGDSNLVAGNIKSGVSIFGVSGTLEEGGASSGEQVEWSANEDAIIHGNINGSYFNDRVERIKQYAFYGQNLTTVSFPKVTYIDAYAFQYCFSLTTVSFPNAISIGTYAFQGESILTIVSFPKVTKIDIGAFKDCYRLTTVSFPKATNIHAEVFTRCDDLTTVSFPNAVNISAYAFRSCYNLKSLYLMGSSLCKLDNRTAFSSTPIGGYSASAGTYGSIYVPASLLTQYKTATNWTYLSNRFVGINPLITFTIDGTEYQAEEGMTWEEWCNSEYAIDESGGHFMTNTQEEVITSLGTRKISGVLASDIIIEGVIYTTTAIEGDWW